MIKVPCALVTIIVPLSKPNESDHRRMGFITDDSINESHDTESLIPKPTKTKLRFACKLIMCILLYVVLVGSVAWIPGYFGYEFTIALNDAVKTQQIYKNSQSWCTVTNYSFKEDFCCERFKDGPYTCNVTTLNIHMISTKNSSITYDGSIQVCTDIDTSIINYNNVICYHNGKDIVKVVPPLPAAGVFLTVFTDVAVLFMAVMLVGTVIYGIIRAVREY